MKEGWEYKKIGELCEILDSQRRPVTKRDRKEGIYPYYGASGIQDFVDSYIFDGRYLLVGEDGAKWGSLDKSAYIVEGKCWVNNHAHILQINDTIIDRLLEYYLVFEDLTMYITGAIVPKLTQKALVNIEIPVPPRSIQKQIVSELDLLSGIVEKQKAQLEELDKLAQSIFYDMFGDPVTNEKGWRIYKMNDLCEYIVDCPHSTPIKSKSITKYPCIRTSELKGGSISWDSMQYLEKDEYEKRITRLKPIAGDIVFGREGTIGDAVVLPEGYFFSLGQRTMLLRAKNELISSIYLHKTLMSEWIRKQISNVNVSSTVAHVNIKDFKCFDVPLPPLSLQQEFAAKVEAIEAMKAKVRQSIKEAETLFNERMDYYFN